MSPGAAVIALLSLLVASTGHAQDYLPDPVRNPGMVDETLSADYLCSHHIKHPNLSWLKKKLMIEHGLDDPSQFQLDHRVPLCAGGAPKDQRNLWLQPRAGQWGAGFKDQLETSVCRLLCNGGITLEAAQAIFLAPDWTVEYDKFFTPSPVESPQ